MTLFRIPLRSLGALAALCLCAATAQAVDELDSSGNLFNAPGYPRGSAGAPGAGAYPGAGGYGATPGGAPLPGPGLGGLRSSGQGSAGDSRASRFEEASQIRREPRPPARPSEFQRFVESATGRLLPIFGSSFFSEAADTFNPVDNVPVSADYTVGPGDEIVLRAWGSIDVDYRSTVDRNGMLNLPKIGSFSVAGVKAADLERHLRAQLGRLFTNFNLSVGLGQLRAVKVFVVGPAQQPGVYTLPSQSTLLSALVAAGGPATNGSMRRITLRRDGRVVSEIDVYDFLVLGDKSKDVQLAAGDVVVVQPAGPRVAITGAVDARAIFELRTAQEPLREVLRYAGGTPVLANPNRVHLERIDATQPRAARFVEEFSLDAAGLQKPLRDGDVLTLLQISPQFANAVTLKGHVAQPLRHPYQPGMRIRDLIPDREALISPDFYRRKNLLVQVIEEDEVRPSNRLDAYGNPYFDPAYPVYPPYPTPSTSRPDADPRRDASRNGGYGMGAAGGRVLPPGSGAASNNNYLFGGLAGGRNPLLPPSAQDSRAGRAAGSVDPAYAGRDALDARRDALDAREANRIAAARAQKTPAALFDELNWDYATIERLNRADLSTQVIPFSLGKAILQGDEANNLELLPGDVVTVYSQKDIRVPVSRQTRLVSLEGEVNAPGIYQLTPGETLRSLLARAGGFTPQAYVYGLEFSREETRQRQRENLQTAMARLETLGAVQSARDAANRRDDAAGAATSASVSNAATQAQLTRLSRIEPNGRIALELTPDVTSLDGLPDLPMEAADRVSVPSRPGFVTVAGAVVNSNAFVWRPGRTAGEYLQLAGADEAADPSNMFILRADGTVTKTGDKRGWFSRGGLESQVMQPGDALIVPTQLDFETWGRALVRNLKDFSQIFSGFGIGIAAINTLK